jgi:hypothetical protein
VTRCAPPSLAAKICSPRYSNFILWLHVNPYLVILGFFLITKELVRILGSLLKRWMPYALWKGLKCSWLRTPHTSAYFIVLFLTILIFLCYALCNCSFFDVEVVTPYKWIFHCFVSHHFNFSLLCSMKFQFCWKVVPSCSWRIKTEIRSGSFVVCMHIFAGSKKTCISFLSSIQKQLKPWGIGHCQSRDSWWHAWEPRWVLDVSSIFIWFRWCFIIARPLKMTCQRSFIFSAFSDFIGMTDITF